MDVHCAVQSGPGVLRDPLFVEALSQLPEMIDRVVNDDDVVLMLGAGDISRLAAEFQASGTTQVEPS